MKKKYLKKNIYCTLLLSGDKEIKYLNNKFRKKNISTDVLSFPFQTKKELENLLKREKEIYLGDMVININKIKIKILSLNLIVYGYMVYYICLDTIIRKKKIFSNASSRTKYFNLINA